MGGADYTFVTVTHRGDHGLLRLQARSLARYLDPDLATELVVVDNPERAGEARRRELLADYGPLAPKVRFLEARDVVEAPLQMAGWWSQQVLKLLVADQVSTERYVVLDAKNHLVFPLARDFFESPSGQLRSRLEDYSRHPLLPWLRKTVGYFGLRLLPPLRFLPTTTPFALDTALVREVVDYLESRERAPFPEAFMRGGGSFTEFFLVVAYVMASRRDVASYWELSADWSPALWAHASEEDVLRTVARIDERETPFFALHRRLLPMLSPASRAAVADLWWRRGLYGSPAAALDALGGDLRSDTQWAADVDLPGVSVIVPTRNRPAALAHTLETLRVQDYPADRFELIVVDDGSTVPAEVPDGVRLIRHRVGERRRPRCRTASG
jgi:hypothetical protein